MAKAKYLVGYTGGLFGGRRYIEVTANGYREACSIALDKLKKKEKYRIRSIWAEGFTNEEGLYHASKTRRGYTVFDTGDYKDGVQPLVEVATDEECKQ